MRSYADCDVCTSSQSHNPGEKRSPCDDCIERYKRDSEKSRKFLLGRYVEINGEASLPRAAVAEEFWKTWESIASIDSTFGFFEHEGNPCFLLSARGGTTTREVIVTVTDEGITMAGRANRRDAPTTIRFRDKRALDKDFLRYVENWIFRTDAVRFGH
jgi:hypothetical protein